MTQPSLFPHLGTLPDRHLGWFRIANSQRPEHWCQPEWYATKTLILQHHGLPDGKDLQTLHDTCHRCTGGIWCRGLPWEELCYCCNGTGIYRIRHVVLYRYLLGGRVYHVPMGWDGTAPTRDWDAHPRGARMEYLAKVGLWAAEVGYTDHLRSLVKKTGDQHQASLAALKLMRAYRPELLFRLFRQVGTGRRTVDWIYRHNAQVKYGW